MTLYDDITVAERARIALERRRAHAVKVKNRLRDLRATLSPNQARYVQSRAPRRRLKGSRQSGKSHVIVVDHTETGFAAKCHSFYVAPTSKSARNAVWLKLGAISSEYELGIELREGLFQAVFPTGALWSFEGAHDMARVQRLRGGTITGKLTIDEGGFYPERVAREIVGPVATAMFLASPSGQRMAIASSPALQRRGLFFELGQSAEWEQHSLCIYDNPVIKDPEQALADMRAANAWTEATPAFQREGLGLEVDDATHNVYDLTELNLIDHLPDGPWTTIMFYDFGKNDQSAVAVVGWRDHDPALYVLHVEGHSDLDIEDVCQLAKPLDAKWNPIGHYGDAGGGGAQHMDYMRRRHGIPVRPVAKGKHYKKPAIDALNADMRRGHYKVLRSSPLVEQMQALQWDPTALARGDHEEHPAMPNDLCDVAGVYAHVQAKHYRAEPHNPPPPPVGSEEHWRRWSDDGLARAAEQAAAHNARLDELEAERAYLTGGDWED